MFGLSCVHKIKTRPKNKSNALPTEHAARSFSPSPSRRGSCAAGVGRCGGHGKLANNRQSPHLLARPDHEPPAEVLVMAPSRQPLASRPSRCCLVILLAESPSCLPCCQKNPRGRRHRRSSCCRKRRWRRRYRAAMQCTGRNHHRSPHPLARQDHEPPVRGSRP